MPLNLFWGRNLKTSAIGPVFLGEETVRIKEGIIGGFDEFEMSIGFDINVVIKGFESLIDDLDVSLHGANALGLAVFVITSL